GGGERALPGLRRRHAIEAGGDAAQGSVGDGTDALNELAPPSTKGFLRKRGGDRGQVTVEFLGVLPLVLIVLAVVWQLVLVGYTYSLAGNSADKGARAGAAKGAGACQDAASKDIPGSWSADIDCAGGDGSVYKATVELHVPILFPGAADFPWTVTGTAGAADETDLAGGGG
ncbi:TadE family protein, partial [Streptomyces sp. 8ZJF_21]